MGVLISLSDSQYMIMHDIRAYLLTDRIVEGPLIRNDEFLWTHDKASVYNLIDQAMGNMVVSFQ